MSLPPTNRRKSHFFGYLATFMLKRKWARGEDSFSTFMGADARLYYMLHDNEGEEEEEEEEGEEEEGEN